jgi:glycosidase
MKNIVLSILFSLALIVPAMLSSQIVTTVPALPTADAPVTVFFNATGTPLEGYTGDVYAHTGVTVGDSTWKHVIADWNVNIPKAVLENLGNNLHKLEISPSIREFYEAGAEENITEMDFVFRSADGNTQTTPDIFIEVFEVGLNVTIITPDINPYFVDPNEQIQVEAEATFAQSISLYVDDVLISTESGNVISGNITASSEIDTKHWIKVVAGDGVSQVMDSIYYYVRGSVSVEELPAGLQDGINYIDNNTVSLVLLAPHKTSVYVFGDFSDWQVSPELQMKRTNQNPNDSDNRYWVTISGLTSGEEYGFQYLIDEELVVADPYSEKVLDPWNDPGITSETYPNLKPYPVGKTDDIVSVFQINEPEYDWQVENFEPPAKEDLIVYELLIRDFVASHNYQTLIDTIAYFKRLGINAIELMPVNEFEGNESWGYNPSFFFAPDKYYGTKNKLKEFIDVCHQNEIAVILDVVYNHAFGSCPLTKMYFDPDAGTYGQPTAENPWLNQTPRHPFNVGYDFNHESLDTKYFIKRATRHWVEEYRIDGYRFDLSKGFTQFNSGGDVGLWGHYDPSRINIIEDYADAIWEIDPDVYIILEHFSDDDEEQVLTNYGMMTWGNNNYNYNEATMGWNSNSNFNRISYISHGFQYPRSVGYMESHDEERLMAKNINYGKTSEWYNIKDTTIALQRQELAGAFFFTVPGPKMIWQFGELGYDYHINYPGPIGETENRVDNKPIRWDYYGDYRRKFLFNVYASLIDLKKNYDIFRTTDFSLSVSGATKSIHLNDASMNVTIIGNFDVIQKDMSPAFQHTGMWYNYFIGDSLDVSDINENIQLAPGEYRIYTDVKLETPEIGLGVENPSVENGKISYVYPNPSLGLVNIAFTLTQKLDVELDIFNLNGQKVKSLVQEDFGPGDHILKWDARDDRGVKLGKGIYFYQLKAGDMVEVNKIILY